MCQQYIATTLEKKKRCILWIAKYICHWGGRRSQIQNSFNLVNNSVNPSLWEMMNSTSSSGKNIKTPASMLSCEHNRKRFRTKIHFPPRRVPSLSSKQYFSKVKCRQIAVHPAATLKGLKVFIIVIVRQVWGQADLKHGWDYNLYCDGFFFFQYCDKNRANNNIIIKSNVEKFQHDPVSSMTTLKVQ